MNKTKLPTETNNGSKSNAFLEGSGSKTTPFLDKLSDAAYVISFMMIPALAVVTMSKTPNLTADTINRFSKKKPEGTKSSSQNKVKNERKNQNK